MNNGNNKWVVKWLVGALWGVLIVCLTLLANNVIANDKKSTVTHVEIRKEIVFGDEKLRDKIDINQEKINNKLTKISNTQSKILAILEK